MVENKKWNASRHIYFDVDFPPLVKHVNKKKIETEGGIKKWDQILGTLLTFNHWYYSIHLDLLFVIWEASRTHICLWQVLLKGGTTLLRNQFFSISQKWWCCWFNFVGGVVVSLLLMNQTPQQQPAAPFLPNYSRIKEVTDDLFDVQCLLNNFSFYDQSWY